MHVKCFTSLSAPANPHPLSGHWAIFPLNPKDQFTTSHLFTSLTRLYNTYFPTLFYLAFNPESLPLSRLIRWPEQKLKLHGHLIGAISLHHSLDTHLPSSTRQTEWSQRYFIESYSRSASSNMPASIAAISKLLTGFTSWYNISIAIDFRHV